MRDVEEVRGKRVLLKFDARVHPSRQCVLTRPGVFVPNVAGEWIHPDNATPEETAALAQACPSGAIRYERLDGGENESAPRVNVARVRENGPIAIHADATIEGHGSTFRATLCRCGASKDKPFCDVSHNAAGFQATGEPATEESKPLDVRSGALQIAPQKDGPLMVEGNLEIVSGTGRTIRRATKTFFCRCGQSASKLYCDGTHKKVGFVG